VKDRDALVDLLVRDGPGGAPVRDAAVRAFSIVDERAYLAAGAATDGAGEAHFTGLPRGEAWILVEAARHARASTRLVLRGGSRAVEVLLAAEHAIDVLVKDDQGTPVTGADVEVVARDDALPIGAKTGVGGAVRVGRLGVGPWTITASARGFDEASSRASLDGDSVAITLRKLGTIAVHVTDEDDLAAAGARVAVAGGGLWPSRVASVNAQGDVRIGGLTAGTYALRAMRDDYVSPIEQGVTVGRGEEKSVTLKLSPGRFAAIRVGEEEEEAQPIGGAQLTLAEGGLTPFPLEAVADARGRARVGPYFPGSATLSARADGFVSRGAVTVPDPPPRELRVGLVRAGVVTGRVVDARGFPIDGASVQLVGTDPAGGPIFDDPRRAVFQAAHFNAMLGGPSPLVPAGELGVVPGPVQAIPTFGAPPTGVGRSPAAAPTEPWVTRSDGTFRAAPGSPGRVRVVVHHPQYVEAQSAVVTLVSGGEAHIDVVMRAGGTLEGQVVDGGDRPVGKARVTVAATRGSLERSTLTSTDGRFAFAALPDSIVLTATAGDGEEQADAQMGVLIPEGETKEVTVRLPAPREPLPVSVVDDDGWPVDAAQVSASSLSTEVPVRVTAFTDARGETALRAARGVPLHVEVRAPGHAPRVTTTDGTLDSLRIELSPAETATGQVTAARGRDAVAGAQVVLYSDVGVRRARTDARGAFILSELAPGPARLRVRAAGFAPSLQAIFVPDDGGRQAFDLPRIDLTAEGTVAGDVVDAKGTPVAGARIARDHAPTWLTVGSNPQEIAVTDAKGNFVLRGLAEGTVALEAYAPDLGRARIEGVKVVAGRTTEGVRFALGLKTAAGEGNADVAGGPAGSVAVTLGETVAPTEVVVVSVAEGSEAERSGMAPGDILLTVDGATVHTIEQARARLSGPLSADVVVTARRREATIALRVGRENVRR
jgi:hypothetical protein